MIKLASRFLYEFAAATGHEGLPKPGELRAIADRLAALEHTLESLRASATELSQRARTPKPDPLTPLRSHVSATSARIAAIQRTLATAQGVAAAVHEQLERLDAQQRAACPDTNSTSR